MNISIAIPTYNSSSFIYKSLIKVIKNDIVSEIIISDDDSSDFEELKKVCYSLKSDKIKIFKNVENFKALKNKFVAVSKCSNNIVALIDSDNIIDDDYINSIDLNYSGIQMPSFSKPNFDYRKIIGEYGLKDIKKILQSNLQDDMFVCLNAGNFVINRDLYISTIEKYIDYDASACDVLYFNYLWLKSGKKMKIVEGMEYEHTIRYDSFWMTNATNSRIVGDDIKKLIMNDL
jgi:glycosyltransferase involved in cell wall biosynthesis